WKLPREPQPLIERMLYEDTLEKTVPVVVDAAGIEALRLLTATLEAALDAFSLGRGRSSPYDSSSIWRPAIENHSQNGPPVDLKEWLVVAVGDAAERIVAREPDRIEEVIAELDGHRRAVFRRIALHLLRVGPASVEPLVRERLTNRELFDDPSLHHEYALLLRGWFPRLAEEERATILGWIAEQLAASGDEEKHARYHAARWLTLLQEHLPAKWSARYE